MFSKNTTGKVWHSNIKYEPNVLSTKPNKSMIFYQLTRKHDQKHPHPPPKIISKEACYRYFNSLFNKFTITTIVFSLLLSSQVKAQNITIESKQESLRSVMDKIERQSGYDFWYDKNTINESLKITISFTNQPLEKVVKSIFIPRDFVFEVVDRTIFIKRASETSAVTNKSPANQIFELNGIVEDSLNIPIVNATIAFKGTNIKVNSNADGSFKIRVPKESGTIIVSLVGYKTVEIPYNRNNANSIKILLQENPQVLKEVEIISTGYQSFAKERATGSFSQLDKSLITRSVSTNVLDRLDGITSGLIFTKGNSINAPKSSIEIRGRTTLFSNAEPLIVVDNFAYDGDLTNINPNDIESITVLKDAAAASIWGSRSGNGVIVITTKKGKLNSPASISFVSNLNIGEKPNLYYIPQINSAEYVDVEQFLFKKGAFNSIINNGYGALSPAVEIFNAAQKGLISKADSTIQINKLKGIDSRLQQLEYLYREPINQQYQASLSGGGADQNYFVSIGYDKNLSTDVTASSDRITVNANNNYFFLKNKLEIGLGLIYTSSGSTQLPGAGSGFTHPYSQIADELGNPQIVPRILRPSYVQNTGNGKLLNWLYKPLEELRNGFSSSRSEQSDYRLNFLVKYKIFKGFSASAYYNFQKGVNENYRLNELESFYTRNLINQFSQINSNTGAITYPIPLGSILLKNFSEINSRNGRVQINYDKGWNKNNINILGGSEIRNNVIFTGNDTFYGYDSDTKINQNAAVNTTVNFPYFYGTNSARIVISPSDLQTTNRFLSYYFNGSYTYDSRYILSLSARKDESNIFGVSTNLKGVPLWSAGLAWSIDRESFFKMEWLKVLKLRATIGYTGNVNNSLSALLTASNTSGGTYNTIYASIVNPPNPSLRWEKNQTINIGLDFALKGNRISGSLDFWKKKGLDLIGNSPVAAQTGVVLFTGNSANTTTKGVDVEINSINLNGSLKWYSTFLYNFTTSKVTSYLVSNGSNFNVVSGNYNNPLVGYPFYSLFSFRYAGLNTSGNPQGYLNGTISNDYAGIRNSVDRNDLTYSGSAVPTIFGSLRNSFTFKCFDLSFNVVYKLGYYFRRRSLDNGSLYSTGANYQMADFGKEWQKPGDELSTYIPALIYPSNSTRTSIYTYADVLIEKADHLRLRDLRLGYTISNLKSLNIHKLNVFIYANNLGILWRANSHGIDPDAVIGLPAAKTLAFGLTVNL